MFKEGDCILQPPGIRHQVLESFDDLEVIEVTTPADHATFSDFKWSCPTAPWRTLEISMVNYSHTTRPTRERRQAIKIQLP